ncbi:uncharacterized protein LOC116658945 isoform X2 [Camelus ferus]|uniref:Uncharacterized protein LOC116658945 isoform X2 n=1 Tax=Camelus ferus TaxID=419612 RepID=A0A8B8RSU8_CAMFR|nr:uncharacterized protein LOC116658945 isoform X2 [Camelus ferus]
MVAVVDVIALAVATSTAADRVSHHQPRRPRGKEGRAGRRGGRVTTEGGRKRRRVDQSDAAAWFRRQDRALALAFQSLPVRAPPPDVPCTAGPPPPAGGSRALPSRSSARASSACYSLSQQSPEATPLQPSLATVFWPAGQAPPPLRWTQPPAWASQDAAREREVWSRRTLRLFVASGTWRLWYSGTPRAECK